MSELTRPILEDEIIQLLDILPLPVVILEQRLEESYIDIYCIYTNNKEAVVNSVFVFAPGSNIKNSLPSNIYSDLYPRITEVFSSGTSISVKASEVSSSLASNIQITLSRYKQYAVFSWTETKNSVEVSRFIQELQNSNQDLEEFAYIASHDLQEPLRMVTSFTQLLKKRYADKLDKDANELIDFAVDGARRMKELIDNLLVYSRIATEATRWKEVDLKEVIDTILKDHRLLMEENGVQIIYSDLPSIYTDRSLIQRLFSNLVSNAIKYRRADNPRIVITALKKQDAWLFAVEDNGIGINEKYYNKIFLIFSRLHPKSEYPGTGIGLAICKKIINQLHGRIWLESVEGKGTTFYFTLPLVQQNEH